MTNVSVPSLAFNSSGHLFAGAGQGGVYRSTDNGANWTAVNTGLTYNVWLLAVSPSGYVFAGSYGVFRSSDNGASWTQTGLTNTSIRSLAFNSSGDVFAGTSGDGVYRSTDNGASWTAISAGLPLVEICGEFCYFDYSPVSSLALNSSGDVFAGTSDSGVYRSTDNGASWTAVNTGLTNTSVPSLALNSSGDIFAGTSGGGVFRSTDDGANWTEVNTGLTNTDVRSLALNSSGDIFAGTYGGGVFRSTDNGTAWIEINTGLTNTYVLSLAVSPSGYVFAGTFDGGVFRSVQVATAVEEGPGAIPKLYVLSQNYPNPFNPATTIRYFLPKREKVTLEIYNLLGERVKVLTEGEKSAGEHILTWDGRDGKGNILSSGIYFYRLNGETFRETKRMLFLK